VAASVSDKSSPPCCRVSGKKKLACPTRKSLTVAFLRYVDARDRCAFRRRTSLLFLLTGRVTPSHHVPATFSRPHPCGHHHSDNNGDGDATRSAAGRLVFPSARSTDAPPRESYNGARREVSPARSAVSQPPPASTVVAGDSDARASLWAELKDIRRRARTPGAGVVLPAI